MINIGQQKVNLSQLQDELKAANVDVGAGLGMFGTFLFPYQQSSPGNGQRPSAQPAEFTNPAAVQAVLAKHVAMRPLSDQELNIAYAEANNKGDLQTMQNLVAMAQGLIPRTQVQM